MLRPRDRTDILPRRNPYSLPGHLNVSFENCLDTRWVPHAPAESPPDWLNMLRAADNSPVIPWPEWNGALPQFQPQAGQERELDEHDPEESNDIQQRAFESLLFLTNSTILLLGDSVDRNFVDQFAWLTQSVHSQESFLGDAFDQDSITSWDLPHTATINSDINLKIANLFFYGAMDEAGEFSEMPDWAPPAKAEDRIEELFKPFSERLAYPVRLIQFNTGCKAPLHVPR